MTDAFSSLRQVVVPLDPDDRAHFAQQARTGRIVIGCFGVVFFAVFGFIANEALGAGGGTWVFVVMGIAAAVLLATMSFLLRPAALEKVTTKIVYTGTVTGKRTSVVHQHASPPHHHDPSVPTQSTLHHVALDGVEFVVPVHLVACVVVGKVQHFHALREGEVFRITDAV